MANDGPSGCASGERTPVGGGACAEEELKVKEGVSRYRVCLLGSNGAGKTAIVNQFLTSEYMNTYDASLVEFFKISPVSFPRMYA